MLASGIVGPMIPPGIPGYPGDPSSLGESIEWLCRQVEKPPGEAKSSREKGAPPRSYD